MSKLQYRYTGPHTVLEEVNPVVFRANVNGVVRTVHANKMKRAVPRKEQRPVEQQREPQAVEEHDQGNDEDEEQHNEPREEYEWEELAPEHGWDELQPIPDSAINEEEPEEDNIGVPVSLIAETQPLPNIQHATETSNSSASTQCDSTRINRLFREL